MTMISVDTRRKAAQKAGKAAASHPTLALRAAKTTAPAARLGLKASKPVVKRRAKQRADQINRAARTLGEALTVYGPTVAYQLGLAEEPPKPKRIAPRVAAGVLVGAGAMYFLEPETGQEHRQKVLELVS